MSRRRISVKELGVVDCEGWLHRRKEGRSFLGSKWKRYWFLLKKSSLYWYKDKMADQAEGFINLSGFSIQQAKQSRRKHAMTAAHPQVVTIFIAAESFTDMNRWISKLSEAAEACDIINTEECYSEGSDQEDCDECVSPSCSLDSGQPVCGSSSCTLQGEDRRRSTLEGAGLSRNRRRRKASRGASVWLDLPRLDAGHTGVPLPVVLVQGERVQDVNPETPPDEMENLYVHLKSASLSLIGRPGQRDFKASFIRRCQNDKLNEKLHLLRILSSTLKAKESELQAVDQILMDPALTAPSYRSWKRSNPVLLQEIRERDQAAGGAAELSSGQASVT
ncbi:LOW QUALITY PROTEIN: interactor protein for cytohesin exchange factors 1 [Notolabrus celidotus]|uniref:LOW QUALITY PROTEIN: interactor protein for cytohesin exchange factors 1 n=1 Tax=Notolabrus celidotus TaxID=1203425 RepID=UPI00148F69ED|nr:LOW QUALITY PROTEIN: interactor protein for cytohesin exchange factors 1 [Notolabrus celidotus]